MPSATQITHLGFDAHFHHPAGNDLELSERVIDSYENAKEQARVFLDVSDGGAIDVREVLRRFGRNGLRERLAEQSPPENGILTVPIQFPEGVLRMETVEGLTDVSVLIVILQVPFQAEAAKDDREEFRPFVGSED